MIRKLLQYIGQPGLRIEIAMQRKTRSASLFDKHTWPSSSRLVNAARPLRLQLIALSVSFLAESSVRCWRIQISSSAMGGRDRSRRMANCSLGVCR
jgi:hypothetical protein